MNIFIKDLKNCIKYLFEIIVSAFRCIFCHGEKHKRREYAGGDKGKRGSCKKMLSLFTYL